MKLEWDKAGERQFETGEVKLYYILSLLMELILRVLLGMVLSVLPKVLPVRNLQLFGLTT